MKLNIVLRRLRQTHCLSSGNMALVIGISKSYLSEIEKGSKNINLKLLNKYADYFDTTLSCILKISEVLPEDNSGEEKIFRADIKQLLEILDLEEPKP